MTHLRTVSAALTLIACSPQAAAIDTTDTRMLRMPTISESHVAFAYDNDLWIAGRAGGAARRLTTAEGQELNPVLSPDGQWLAFSGNYDGNLDAYVMPATGGEVRRLTWHPGNDIVVGFTGDSRRVLFYTPRSVHTNRHRHLYTVDLAGGPSERLPVPTGIAAALSPDGGKIAYNPHPPAFLQWKNYRGGRISRLWIMDLESQDVFEVPKPDGGANDTSPMWIGDTLYFTSDRDGEFNLYRLQDEQVVRLTAFEDFPVMNARAGAGVIVFEWAGRLRTYDPATEEIIDLRISAPSDLREARSRWASGDEWVRDADPSPDGKRVALEFRGEVVTVPAEKGHPRNLTESTGAHDRSPAWAPDGSRIAWFSDAGGEYGLHVRTLGADETRRYELNGAGFYFDPVWSPDGERLAFRDNALALHVIELDSGTVTEVAREPVYGPVITMSYDWSPDSAWLAYTLNEAGLTQAVHLYDVEAGESRQITSGLAEVGSPVFDADGEQLYVLASTDSGPVKDWFAQSNNDMTMSHGVYVITLAADGADPLAPQEDEVAADDGEDDGQGASEDESDDGGASPARTVVDLEGLTGRIQSLPVGEATRHGLAAGTAGHVYWIETVGNTSFASYGGPGALKRFLFEEREAKTLLDEVDAFELTASGEQILYRRQGQWFLADATGELEAGKGQLALNAVKVRVEPRAEWAQIFDEAWRINRDYFYATNYHGADWGAVREKYAPLVAHASTREDVFQIIRWMASELAVGHSYGGYGESIEDPEEVSVGLLGADYAIENGRYRFARILGSIEGGRYSWSADGDAPLARPGVDVSVGDYLLAVDGIEVTADESLYRYFEETVGRPITITVADAPDGARRDVKVVPIDSEGGLRYRQWVEGNIAKVHEATDGRIAYVHLPDTNVSGHASFKRYFHPQSHLEGIILDERYNGGGLVADYYIDILRRPFGANWAMRYGADLPSPRAAIHGPKVMIIDEMAGSGGDLLPWMFRKYGLGPLVGTRTWGGLVGILGFPTLMDGGSVTAPNLAIWDEDGWIVENVGVAPDHEVFQWPSAVNAGGDPQLEKAIELALEGLPPKSPERDVAPPFPTRAIEP